MTDILTQKGISYARQVALKNAINDLTDACYGLSSLSGWWTNPKTGEPLEITKDLVGMKIALIHSEVSEALEGFRKDKDDEHLPTRKSLEVELGDAVIRICDLAGALNLDLGGAILAKLAYNQSRPDHKLANRAAPGGKAF